MTRYLSIQGLYRQLLRHVRRNPVDEGKFARSMALGLFIGCSPTVGLQMVLSIAVCILLNRLLALKFDAAITIFATLIVNPVTMVPVYSLYLSIGCLFMSCGGVTEITSSEGLLEIVSSGGVAYLAIILGSIPFMIVFTIAGYFLSRRLFAYLAERLKKKFANFKKPRLPGLRRKQTQS